MTTIIGSGWFAPETGDSNQELEQELGLEPGWIKRRVGVEYRPVAGPETATSDLAIEAGRKAIADAGINPQDIGMLLLATSTPDHPLPPSAPVVSKALGLGSCGAVDLAGACAGFLYALSLADAWAGLQQTNALVIGANILTRRARRDDPNTRPIFSDAAGAVVLGPAATGCGILSSWLDSDSTHWQDLHIPEGGSRKPYGPETHAKGAHLMTMANGKRLFRDAVNAMTRSGEEALARAGLTINDIDWWVPHQANARMIADAGDRLDCPSQKTIITLDRYGNSSAATIPLSLAVARSDGRIKAGQTLLLTAVGSGLLCGGMVIRI